MNRGGAIVGVALFAAFLGAGCVAPAARRPAGSISGADIDGEYARLRRRAEERIEEQKERVERVGKRLLEHVPGKPEIQFLIIPGVADVNAGATFGQVAVTSGMLDFIKSDDELAVVLGHEIAHITEGHVMKGAIGNLALGVLAIVVETQAPGAGNLAGGLGQLFLNRYTQSQERAADDVGLEYTYAAGYDPRAAADVQERLAISVPQTMSAGYFDTHPSSVERMVTARQHAEKLLEGGPPPGREEVLASERRARELRERRRGESQLPSLRDEDREGRDEPRREAGREERAAVESSDTDCRRAETYLQRAEDVADPEEREALRRRAERYCPSLVR